MITTREIPDLVSGGVTVVLTVGTFDGVHLGHQRILGELISWAREIDGQAIVLTFAQNPQDVLRSSTEPSVLTGVEEKLGHFEKLGVDRAIVLDFTEELAREEPEEFFRNELLAKLGPVGVVFGPGHTFGKNRRGDRDLLVKLSGEFGFSVKEVPGVEVLGELVSSTRIRRLISAGDMASAQACLGRPYSFRGRVVVGKGRGRKLGYPTANLIITGEGKLLPPDGVYVSMTGLNREVRESILYIGTRPTFNENDFMVEVHIFDYGDDIYGQEVEVFVLEKIRGGIVFKDVQALRQQIFKDENIARNWFREHREKAAATG